VDAALVAGDVTGRRLVPEALHAQTKPLGFLAAFPQITVELRTVTVQPPLARR
jgi:hypothetical protein